MTDETPWCCTGWTMDCALCDDPTGAIVHCPGHPATDANTETVRVWQLHNRRAHPDYEYATTNGPRKQWDDADQPPAGDDGEPEAGWEPNTAAGRDGWDRFDYHEEAYWRRPKTTPDNPATSSDTPDNPLRDRLAALREPPPDAPETITAPLDDLVAAVLGVRDEEVEQLRARIATLEHVAAGNKRHVQLIIPDLERAEATLARVHAAADQLHRAVLNTDGVPLTAYDRGVDTAVRRILAALDQPAAHDDGPTVAEAAADDKAHWADKYAGEGA